LLLDLEIISVNLNYLWTTVFHNVCRRVRGNGAARNPFMKIRQMVAIKRDRFPAELCNGARYERFNGFAG
jgi:hypothetical protein